ncbi:MAG: hypothetical protein ETSY1_16640, partial [Candidatus Entotheonella factor]
MEDVHRIIKVFVSYSHQDAKYLDNNSLLGYLKGLEDEQIAFWTDRQIQTGELWDEVIKAQIQDAHIALVLVSQSFLDSKYCQDVEIRGFLASKSYLFPVILSACEWRRHEWLSSRQFLPGGDETLEEHYTDSGQRKRLFLKIRQQLRDRAEQLRQAPPSAAGTTSPIASQTAPSTQTTPTYSGPTKLAFFRQLGHDWRDLATVLGIADY